MTLNGDLGATSAALAGSFLWSLISLAGSGQDYYGRDGLGPGQLQARTSRMIVPSDHPDASDSMLKATLLKCRRLPGAIGVSWIVPIGLCKRRRLSNVEMPLG